MFHIYDVLNFVHIRKIKLSAINEITLLSTEEWEKAKEIKGVPKFTSWWWLRSPGYSSDHAALVNDDGDISSNGGYVHGTCACVRPAFRIPNLESEIGEKIFVENTLCTVIDKDYALSDIVICQHRFDESSNDYETSEIRRFINSDEFKQML